MTEESTDRLRTALMRTARYLRTQAADERLTITQSSVLATLVREGPATPGDLAAGEALNPTLLSRVLAHLEAEGLVRRAAHPTDGRSTTIQATAAGRRRVARLRARRVALLLDRLAALPPAHVAALEAALPALEALAEVDA
jgi:DNA-binding MarR family transcriptional regulator